MFNIAKLQIVKDITRWSALALLIYLLFSCAILQLGIVKFKSDRNQQKEFIDQEIKKVDGLITYQQYGSYGIERLLLGSPLHSLFYNSSTFKALQARVEISTQYKLYRPELGKHVFNQPTGGNLDFSWFFLFFGTALYSLWAFFLFRNKRYLRFLKDFAGRYQIYTGIIVGRAIVVFLSILIMMLAVWGQFRLNGIILEGADLNGLFTFFAFTTGLIILFTGLSSAFGAIWNLKLGIPLAVASWLILVFIWPEALNAVFSLKAGFKMKSIISQQMKKNELYSVFEKESLKNTGRYSTIPERDAYEKQRIEYYWDEVSKEILAIDKETIDQTLEISKDFHIASIFNPVTFYKSVNNELGGKGLNAYNDFYRENLEIQRKFLRFVFNKRYYENYSKVEPYLPGPALVVRAKPSPPGYFYGGCLVFLVYLALVHLFGYFMYGKYMYPAPMAAGGYESVKIAADYGRVDYIDCDEEDLENQVYNIFSGYTRGFNGELSVGNQSLVTNREKNFVYIPRQSDIPGHFTVKLLLHTLGKIGKIPAEIVTRFKNEKKDLLNTRWKKLPPVDRTLLLMDICEMKGADMYLTGYQGNFGDNQTKINHRIQQIKKNGGYILCMSEIFACPDNSYVYVFEGKKYHEAKGDKGHEESS